MAPHSSTFAWKIPWMEEQSMASLESDTTDFTFTFHFHALEKEMATHSSVLAWRIPGTRTPGGLPSMGLHRVGHDWRDLAAAAAMIIKFFAGYCLIRSEQSNWHVHGLRAAPPGPSPVHGVLSVLRLPWDKMRRQPLSWLCYTPQGFIVFSASALKFFFFATFSSP